jgi:hypothetical protein
MAIVLLILKKNKIFITKLISNNLIDYRFNDWLKLYNSIKIYKIFYDKTIDYLTYKYMNEYGIDNVRSDLYYSIKLTDNEIKNINDNIFKYIKSKNNKKSIYVLDILFNIPYSSSDDESDLFNESDWYNTDSDD